MTDGEIVTVKKEKEKDKNICFDGWPLAVPWLLRPARWKTARCSIQDPPVCQTGQTQFCRATMQQHCCWTNINSYPSDFSFTRLARLRLIMKSAGDSLKWQTYIFFSSPFKRCARTLTRGPAEHVEWNVTHARVGFIFRTIQHYAKQRHCTLTMGCIIAFPAVSDDCGTIQTSWIKKKERKWLFSILSAKPMTKTRDTRGRIGRGVGR